MRRIFTLSLALVCLLAAQSSVAQCTTSAQITPDQVYTFDNSATNSQGFGGNFGWVSTSSSTGQLESNPVSSGTTITLLSPTLTMTGPSLLFRFQLGGSANVTDYTIYAETYEYVPKDGKYEFIDYQLCSSTTLLNSPTSSYLNFAVPTVPAIQNQQPFRLKIVFTISGALTHTKTIDNFGFVGTSQASAPLPVHFSNISVRKATEGAVVAWNVGTEQNVSGYDVEKSTDGRSFTKIGFVAASNLSAYNFTDAKAGAINFYRVKSVDIDGKFGYSTVVVLNGGASSVVVKAFMSDKNTLTVQHDAAQAGSRISVISMDGRVVKVQQPAADAQQTKVDMSSAQTGLYIIRYDNGQGGTESIKIAK